MLDHLITKSPVIWKPLDYYVSFVNCFAFLHVNDAFLNNAEEESDEISWNEKETLDACDAYNYKHEKYLAKDCLLKDKCHKFAHLDVGDGKHSSRHLALNKTRTEFQHCFDGKQTHKDCNIVSSKDAKSRLQLQNDYNSLQEKHVAMCAKLNDIHDKSLSLKQKYQMHKSLDHDVIMRIFLM